MGRRLRFSQDTSDTRGLGSPSNARGYYDHHSSAQVSDAGTRGHAEKKHDDTHDAFGCLLIAIVSFSESQSFLISRRIDSGRAFLPSKKLDLLRTVPRFWEGRFCQLVLMQIAFVCFYLEMPKLLFRIQLVTVAAAARLFTPANAALTSSTATVLAVATISPATAASGVVAPASGQKRKGCP